jgi:ubiquinone/menaquinone biosynthesis C-methylase UbiE
VKWLRQGPSPYQTALAMVGARAGDRVLVVGAGDAALPAELARVTGLNGETRVADHATGADSRVRTAAARAGTLVEFSPVPPTALALDANSVDIVILNRCLARPDVADPAAAAAEALRVVKPGGRLIVVEGPQRRGPFGLARGGPAAPAGDVLALIERAGGRAGRLLAEAEGVTYFEALKPRVS